MISLEFCNYDDAFFRGWGVYKLTELEAMIKQKKVVFTGQGGGWWSALYDL